jgi:hypothetical protein
MHAQVKDQLIWALLQQREELGGRLADAEARVAAAER